ncbi:LPS assembly lipoprotein LptE [Aliivibrio sp. S4TY2]|uniref:LPS-assembly lipoprotein LptE n=1 Tax=unclassified Aliivibrio TaxID=2645654 RepID=UPI0023797AB9|nr:MULTISPECIES: LPS assembly lipoprotein LptE [unclassified Aliivibrio]MDD9157060.1 LPS assembly lipoprotein LptE [Aliivibrio sp. S4TY2]MDD9161107.1 LPS assembly lipoprotein LptE [Aliivibrio sp. S4TY1]MDD9164972.1 LPS assembly lipoprotein LptE [Aliivibrio sp. S4MY2]MDD9169135.1 LPS assembly lipoprotein LptE [Aliivibrio sp. S4MY4]MDD9185863.1 LPS assembly lipoprotein LptE [Aliivibrio sp. S4MY3]
MVSACGFHLRGNYLLPEELHEVSLTSFDQYSDLTRNVQKQLRMNGIRQVAPTTVTPSLNLISESLGERTLSLYQNSRAAEKALTYTVTYSVLIPEHDIKTYTTSVNRNYLDNPLTALAKSVERDMIEDEMRTQAAEQILRQMARLKADDTPVGTSVETATLDDNTESKVTTKEVIETMDTSTGNIQ